MSVEWARNLSMGEKKNRFTMAKYTRPQGKIYRSIKREDVDIQLRDESFFLIELPKVWMVGVTDDGKILLKDGGNTEAGLEKWGVNDSHHIRSKDLLKLLEKHRIEIPTIAMWQDIEIVYFGGKPAILITPPAYAIDKHDTDEWYSDVYECSKCGERIPGKTRYCPDCGSRLEEKADG